MLHSTTEYLVRNISMRQLQIFEAVVRLGGVTRASEALKLTQPTVSMQVKKLTDTIGLPLIERGAQGNRTTTAGRDVYTAAQEILTRLEALGDSTSELTGVIKGSLSISVITTAKYFMPHLLGAFIAKHPQVIPRLTVTNRSQVIQRLKSNEDDLIIMGQVPNEMAVQSYPLIDNQLVVVAPFGHPLTSARNIPLEALAQERHLVREPGSGTRQAVERVFDNQGVKITPFMELGSSEAIKQGVMAGLGISVLSIYNLRLELAGNHIAVLDAKGFPLVRPWYAVCNQNKQLSLAARTFLDFIHDNKDEILFPVKQEQA